MELVEATRVRLTQVRELYEKTFAEEEQKPFRLLTQKRKEGTLHIYAIEGKLREFVGLMVTVNVGDCVLIDYMVILPERRGKGAGAEALEALRQKYPDCRIIANSEDTERAKTPEDERVRKKEFFLKNGFELQPFRSSVIWVRYEVLATAPITFEEYFEIYRTGYGDKIGRFSVENVVRRRELMAPQR